MDLHSTPVQYQQKRSSEEEAYERSEFLRFGGRRRTRVRIRGFGGAGEEDFFFTGGRVV